MQVACPELGEFASDGDRIVAVFGRFRKIALEKPYALATLQIDRWNNVQDDSPRKFRSNRDPADDDRSG